MNKTITMKFPIRHGEVTPCGHIYSEEVIEKIVKQANKKDHKVIFKHTSPENRIEDIAATYEKIEKDEDGQYEFKGVKIKSDLYSQEFPWLIKLCKIYPYGQGSVRDGNIEPPYFLEGFSFVLEP